MFQINKYPILIHVKILHLLEMIIITEFHNVLLVSNLLVTIMKARPHGSFLTSPIKSFQHWSRLFFMSCIKAILAIFYASCSRASTFELVYFRCAVSRVVQWRVTRGFLRQLPKGGILRTKPVKYLINYVPRWRPYRTVYNLTFSKFRSRKVFFKLISWVWNFCHCLHYRRITSRVSDRIRCRQVSS